VFSWKNTSSKLSGPAFRSGRDHDVADYAIPVRPPDA
jgi:hypothetical protein